MNEPAASERTLGSIIGSIAVRIGSEGFPTGHRAAFRRMSFDEPPPLPFYRFILDTVGDDWDRNRPTMRDWITIVAGIAIMSPDAHQLQLGLGAALGETGYSELRLERLLQARGDTRRTLLLRAARFLAAKRKACNWTQAAQLLRYRDDSEEREHLHRRIAGDYYRALDARSA